MSTLDWALSHASKFAQKLDLKCVLKFSMKNELIILMGSTLEMIIFMAVPWK
jgi:hypothetical protein